MFCTYNEERLANYSKQDFLRWNGQTLFKQGGPFNTKTGIHRGPVSRYKLFIEITRYEICRVSKKSLQLGKSR